MKKIQSFINEIKNTYFLEQLQQSVISNLINPSFIPNNRQFTSSYNQ
ncbi:unnamed protein product [Paramecium octaurelia]|uniref:Uncharacterized protein n=1 Tax=Paramecium octaurelia TaxID=43137 RepID=A0A8S1SEK8_PAROT|nr:unnamed protein product [Paramecium octaurelia]